MVELGWEEVEMIRFYVKLKNNKVVDRAKRPKGKYVGESVIVDAQDQQHTIHTLMLYDAVGYLRNTTIVNAYCGYDRQRKVFFDN